jgi:hypothetical protein
MSPRSFAALAGLTAVALLAACRSEASAVDKAPDATASAEPVSEAAGSTVATCAHPVAPGDSAASIRERYGDDAALAMLPGPEGTEFEGVVLWPNDPSRRVEVLFADYALEVLSGVRIGEESKWRVAGLGLGATLEDVRAANGGPFELWGFSWDYGGYVTDLMGGKLTALDGDCSVGLRFGPAKDAELPDALMGEQLISSEDPRLPAARATIEELTVQFGGSEDSG